MKNRLKRPSFDPNVLPENDYSHYHDYHLVGIRTPPTLLSLITPPIAVTRSRSRALLVLWSCQCLWGWFCLIFNANNHYSIIFHFQVILSFVIQMNSVPLPLFGLRIFIPAFKAKPGWRTWVSWRAAPWMQATARLSPRFATNTSPCYLSSGHGRSIALVIIMIIAILWLLIGQWPMVTNILWSWGDRWPWCWWWSIYNGVCLCVTFFSYFCFKIIFWTYSIDFFVWNFVVEIF